MYAVMATNGPLDLAGRPGFMKRRITFGSFDVVKPSGQRYTARPGGKAQSQARPAGWNSPSPPSPGRQLPGLSLVHQVRQAQGCWVVNKAVRLFTAPCSSPAGGNFCSGRDCSPEPRWPHSWPTLHSRVFSFLPTCLSPFFFSFPFSSFASCLFPKICLWHSGSKRLFILQQDCAF